MPKFTISEDTVRKVTERYVKSIKSDPAKQPAIRDIISGAIRTSAPDKKVKKEDVETVLHDLAGRNIVDDRVIAEASRKVTDQNAKDDLIFSIQSYARQLKKKPTPKDIDEIIKQGKLDPKSSPPFQIKNAVRDYFEGARPLQVIPQNDIRDAIRTQLSKNGPVDDRDVQSVLQKYLGGADPTKPLRPDDIRDVIRQHLSDKSGSTPKPIRPDAIEVPPGPQPTPLSRPETPSEEPEEPTGPHTPAPRSSGSNPPTTGKEVPPKDKRNLTFFEKIRQKMYRYGIKSLTTYSRNWLKDTLYKTQSNPSRKKLLTQGQTVQEAMIGKMFMYFYDAKMKEELPFWDKFPLILCVDVSSDGWYGLNLHYLPLPMRMKLFDMLLGLADNKRLDQMDRLKMSYGILRGFAQFPAARPCFKRYLSHYVRSELLLIEPIDWEIALYIPVEQFQKKTKEEVWKESRKAANKEKFHKAAATRTAKKDKRAKREKEDNDAKKGS